MRLVEETIAVEMPRGGDLIRELGRRIEPRAGAEYIPVRMAVVASDSKAWWCEVGVLRGAEDMLRPESIFTFRQREGQNAETFNAVLVVPTGIGAAIGGHAGDAGPVARLLAGACDTLITHPNVVNASDINELPENGLYVEGSVLARLLMGRVGLERVRQNRVMVLMDAHEDAGVAQDTINAVSAARAAMGLECPGVVTVGPPLLMRGQYAESGRAVGTVEGVERMVMALHKWRGAYDAVAIATTVDVPAIAREDYFQTAGETVNPWGGVEAMLTHALSMIANVPVAHAPMEQSREAGARRVGIVDPRKAAEAVSVCYLHCVLKGLHRSPRIVPPSISAWGVLTARDVGCLVIPDGCIGLPTLAALQQGIPLIAVRENTNLMRNDLDALPFAPGQLLFADTYLEAAGIMTALRNGIAPTSVRRPLQHTTVLTMEVP